MTMQSKLRLLVVDDEGALVAALESILEREGFSVDTAEDGDVALKLIRKNRYDLMTLGIKMPRVDGFQVLREMRSLPYPPKTIMLTGFATLAAFKECVRLGAADFVSKPFDASDLLATIYRVLGS